MDTHSYEGADDSTISLGLHEHKPLKNLSFSGGGFRGLAFLGCIKALQEKDVIFNVQSYAGSSVGAFIATMVVCGADYNYLKEVSVGACQFFATFKMDIMSILKNSSFFSFKTNYGMYKTEDLREYIKKCIQNVLKCDDDPTFSDLYKINPVELIITASCLETKTPFYFSHETTKDTPISEALAISCSIPILFGKNVYDDKTLMDGCLLEKLPMQCWPQDEIENTMAFLLDSSDRKIATNTFTDYIHALESLISQSQDSNYKTKYKNAITFINSGNMVSHGTIPSSTEINRVIYAAYFQTLAELSRRNFIDEFSVPKYQEISSLIMSEDDFNFIQNQPEHSTIKLLIIVLLIVTILRVAFSR